MKKTSIKDKIEGNELDLSLNGLTEVPVPELANAQKATHLDLSCNEIRSLPNNFASLTHLVKIDLSKNFLTELPQNFGNLTNLEYLDLYGNHIATLPISFCRLKRLKWLDLKNNPLTPKLKEIAGDCLDPKQCQMCAKNIVSFMQGMESELERQKQKRLKEERAREAARLAKEQEELAEQRRIKKAEKERRKAETKAKLASQGKLGNQDHSNDYGKSNATNKVESTNETKSGSCWKLCLFSFIVLPVLLVSSLVGFLVFQGHDLQSISNVLHETFLQTHETLLVWWSAFALPHYLVLKASILDWLRSVGVL